MKMELILEIPIRNWNFNSNNATYGYYIDIRNTYKELKLYFVWWFETWVWKY